MNSLEATAQVIAALISKGAINTTDVETKIKSVYKAFDTPNL